jgi:Ca2+-binding EF-hand superfamily protein
MRAITLLALLIFGIAAIFIAPAITTGQPGGFKGGGKKGFGMGMDAGQIFDRIANGRPSIPISEIKFGRTQVAQYAQDKGITNGMLTRQQFIDFQTQMMSARAQFPPPGGGMMRPSGPAVTIVQGPSGMDVINQLADADFRRRDANGDGKLNQDEMPPPLRFGLAKYDRNGDGFIDMYEYREYFAARLAGNVGGKDDSGTRGIASIIIEEEELDRKPVVFRAGGQMPAGLPPWFKELDTDGDGQVALYEWRKGGKNLDEFREWDLNDDGFITPEEAIKCLAKNGAKASTSPGAVTYSIPPSSDRPSMTSGERPPMNGKGPKRKKNNDG